MPKKKSVHKAPVIEAKPVVVESPVVVEVTETPKGNKTMFRVNKKVWTYMAIAVIGGGVVAIPGIHYYRAYDQAQALLQGSNSATDSENARVIAAVSKIYDLPKGESPTIATVSDIEKLKKSAGNTTFFANAQNGDKVLVYKSAQTAILYRPTSGKIIEVAPFVDTAAVQPQKEVAGASDSAQLSLTPSPTASEPAKVVILNGTKTAGLAKQVQSKLSSIDSVSVLSTGNAAEDQEKTTVVYTNADVKGAAQSVATQVGGTLTQNFPTGDNPATDSNISEAAQIIVFLGADYGK